MSERLTVIAGCMFSGKTAELVRLVERAEIAGTNTLIAKPNIDTRYGKPNQIVSHNGVERYAIPIPPNQPGIILENIQKKTGLVAMDEVQFFDPEIVQVVKELLQRNIQVLAAGLPTDFRGEPFGSMPILLALADYLDRLTAICTYEENGRVCGRDATRTQRFVDGKPANWNDPIVLVGVNEYAARCSRHHVVLGKPK